MITPDEYVVLGTKCATTINVRRIFGTKASYPMDWWITPLSALPKLIDNGFMPNLHPSNLEVVGDRTSVRNNEYSILHHHDFPRDEQDKIVSDWYSHIDAVRARHDRRSSRLRELLETSKSVVMFIDDIGWHEWIFEHHRDACFLSETYVRIRDALRVNFPKVEISFVTSGHAEPPSGSAFYSVKVLHAESGQPWYAPESYERAYADLPFARKSHPASV